MEIFKGISLEKGGNDKLGGFNAEYLNSNSDFQSLEVQAGPDVLLGTMVEIVVSQDLGQ